MNKEQKEGFTKGLIYALGMLADDFHQPAIARGIWEESSINPDEAEFCAEYDVAKLRIAVPDLPEGVE